MYPVAARRFWNLGTIAIQSSRRAYRSTSPKGMVEALTRLWPPPRKGGGVAAEGSVAAVHGGFLPQSPHNFDVSAFLLVSWRAARNLGASKHFLGPHCISMERMLALLCSSCCED